jgi:ERO1-like protein alpha
MADKPKTRLAFAFALSLLLGGLGLMLVLPATHSIETPRPVQKAGCACPVGNVSDCCCSFAELEDANSHVVHSLLKRIVATPFFGHFRISLCSKCGLWHDSPMCILRDCSVCECENPPAWTKTDDCAQQVEQQVTSVQPMELGFWKTAAHEDDASGNLMHEVVVDLRDNPERFTGYSGESAAKVWDEIHNRNCFQQDGSQIIVNATSASCMSPAWQRVYNRLISGIHSSISLHIAHGYCLQRNAKASYECAQWGLNVSAAWDRVLRHPERVENLYATFAVLLRAVVKAGTMVTAAVPPEDADFSESLHEWREVLLPKLVHLASSCPKTFAEDEFAFGSTMWDEVKDRLTQLTEIMKCVGCDRCKLWGTLQTQGISTALRILFQPDAVQSLTRQEAVALVNTLERLSSSILYLQEFRGHASMTQ